MDEKIFFYKKSNERSLCIKANENDNPEHVIQLYVDWYNNNFAKEYDYPEININNFTFIDKYTIFDFYDESKEYVKKNKKKS